MAGVCTPDVRVDDMAVWPVVHAHFAESPISAQQIRSFDTFVEHGLPGIVKAHAKWTANTPQSGLATRAPAVRCATLQLGNVQFLLPAHNQDLVDQVATVASSGRGESQGFHILTPTTARVRGLTYAATMVADAEWTYTPSAAGNPVPPPGHARVVLGSVPAMVLSKLCHLAGTSRATRVECSECPEDPGGYFILAGNERVAVAQERQAFNQVFCYRGKPGKPFSLRADFRSDPMDFMRAPVPTAIDMLRAPRGRGEQTPTDTRGHATEAPDGAAPTDEKPTSEGGVFPVEPWHMVVTLARVLAPVPLAVVFRALGVLSDRDILSCVTQDLADSAAAAYVYPSLVHGEACATQEDALIYIGARAEGATGSKRSVRLDAARAVLAQQLYPALGTSGAVAELQHKAAMLGLHARQLVRCAMGASLATDRDDLSNKRLDLAGALLEQVARPFFVTMMREATRVMSKQLATHGMVDVATAIRPAMLTNALEAFLKTGNMLSQRGGVPSRTGVCQAFSRQTHASSLSHLRRTNIPMGKESKQPELRQLHNSHFGVFCPAETPEGQQVGITKNLSLGAVVSTGGGAPAVFTLLGINADGVAGGADADVTTDLSPRVLGALGPSGRVRVLVNGTWVGLTAWPERVRGRLRAARASGVLPRCTSIWLDAFAAELHVLTDAGRPCRPLFRVVAADPAIANAEGALVRCEVGPAGDLRPTHQLLTRDDVAPTPGAPACPPQALLLNPDHLAWLGKDVSTGMGDDLYERLRQNEPGAFEELLLARVVEFLDKAEEAFATVAMTPRAVARGEMAPYSHCELHPCLIMGVCASLIPFPGRNLAPRNTYQSAMGKQAMGAPPHNLFRLVDKTTHVLMCAQRPAVLPHNAQFVGARRMPAGVNCVVAIGIAQGYNMEDSLVMNATSLQRGMFGSAHIETVSDTERRPPPGAPTERFCIPPPSLAPRGRARFEGPSDNSKLGRDGLVLPGQVVRRGDTLIGKVATQVQNGVTSHRDVSTRFMDGRLAVVHNVVLTVNGAGERVARVQLISINIPQIGDKFASRHGQKGTVGLALRQEDMPFTRDGIVPDIIHNPHSIPSRMTVAHLLEGLAGKMAMEEGIEADATAFTDLRADDIETVLRKRGFQQFGVEMMYRGTTGRRLETPPFMAVIYYQRLKHIAVNKIHSRARGPVVRKTGQPVGGRINEGGQRFGEMERDGVLVQGPAFLLRERMLLNGDLFRMPVCKSCGLIATARPSNGDIGCKACLRVGGVVWVEVPQAYKLLMQELLGMGIALRFLTCSVPGTKRLAPGSFSLEKHRPNAGASVLKW